MSEMEEKVTEEQVHYPYAVVIRFRGEGKPYSFGAYDDDYHKGDWVVVETQQGQEMGEVQSDAMKTELVCVNMPNKPVLRKATRRDMDDYHSNMVAEKRAFAICNDNIRELGLDMRLLSASYTLDRSKVLFVYVADQRVDFRELLKRLGSSLHCRIELRQIGERDKAKMFGGIGTCGMECCCSRFKSHFDVISINMAKNQLLALNTEKLSGMCGKLKCCLKYEDDQYKEAIEGLPKMNSQVEYEGEIYRVTSINIMSSEAKLQNPDSVVFISLDDLKNKTISRKGVTMKPKNPEEGGRKHIKKTTVLTNREDPKKANHVSYDLEAPSPAEPKKEVRTFSSRKPKGEQMDKKQNSERKPNPSKDRSRNTGNNRRRPEPKPTGNVTVRTFGKKKKEETK